MRLQCCLGQKKGDEHLSVALLESVERFTKPLTKEKSKKKIGTVEKFFALRAARQ
jgi:hypothetical protein